MKKLSSLDLDACGHRFDSTSRVLEISLRGNVLTSLSVPARYGDVMGVECKPEFIVVSTVGGKATFDYRGIIPWSKLRAELMERFHPAFRSRVKVEILSMRFSSGATGRAGARGRIFIDGAVVGTGRFDSGDFTTCALGKAVADYLELTPQEALRSDDVLISCFALLDTCLDRATSLEAKESQHRNNPLWSAFYRLGQSILSDETNLCTNSTS
jgi:hypothetical protein